MNKSSKKWQKRARIYAVIRTKDAEAAQEYRRRFLRLDKFDAAVARGAHA